MLLSDGDSHVLLKFSVPVRHLLMSDNLYIFVEQGVRRIEAVLCLNQATFHCVQNSGFVFPEGCLTEQCSLLSISCIMFKLVSGTAREMW